MIEAIWLEVWLPNDVPLSVIENLVDNGFEKSSDGFYIPETLFELFSGIAFPYKVTIFQRFIYKETNLETRQNMILDMVNDLKGAGVQGVDNWLEKITPTIKS